jgi:hypothetical protein
MLHPWHFLGADNGIVGVGTTLFLQGWMMIDAAPVEGKS